MKQWRVAAAAPPAARSAVPVLAVLAALVLIAAPAVPAAAEEAEASAADARWDDGFVTTPDGVRIHYLEAAPGPEARSEPSLLFVPGWTMVAEIWQPQIEHFSERHRVVAMDPRGQGRSDHPEVGYYPEARGRDVKAVVQELELAPVVPVCWSMAVSECVAMVEEFGTRGLEALVLVDGLPGGEYDPQWTPRMLSWTGQLLRNREEGTAAFVRSMYLTPQDAAYLQQVTEWSLATSDAAMAALMVGGMTTDHRDALDEIDVPVLLAVTRSPFLPRYEEMRDRIPDVRFEVFEAGHALFVDDSEGFNAVLEEFLAGGGEEGVGAEAGSPAAPEAEAPAMEGAEGGAEEGGR